MAETQPPCPHCPDGHARPRSRPWGVFVASDRDRDGQPTHLYVAPSNGAHVAESDAEWLRALINEDSASASQVIDEILAPLKAQIGVAEYEAAMAARRAREAEARVECAEAAAPILAAELADGLDSQAVAVERQALRLTPSHARSFREGEAAGLAAAARTIREMGAARDDR